jgi:4-amino-4-deoxy-L-arabinose transferase-like glycosyltransferase
MRGRAVAVAGTFGPVALITVVGAALRLWSFDSVGANPFYDAAVRSMSLSWHNFFFGAFEPGGQVSVDKAPADLWLQVASVKLFGFTDVAMRLPEVAGGIVAIPLLYDLVRRLFGPLAGMGAAATLAVLPAAIVTAHSDTMDSVMMALDVLAAWLVVLAAQRRRAWPVVAAGAVVGLAFNVKLFEALIFLPALMVLAVLTGAGPMRRRALALGGSVAALLMVGLGWIAVASLTALGQRPWPIGSSDGSIWNVVFAYDGIDRVRARASAAALALDPPGVLRFFSRGGHGYLLTIGTTLMAALAIGGAALAVAVVERRHRRGRRSLQVAGAAFFGTWLVTGVGLLSHMQRMQPRYLDAVAPAVAAVVGIGVGALAGAPRRLPRTALAASAAGVAVTGILLAHPPTWLMVLAVAAAAGGGLAVAVVSDRGRSAVLAVCALLAVLAVPAAGAVTVAGQHRSDAGLPSRMTAGEVARLSAFLVRHQGGARFEVASSTVVRAAPLIVHDGRPILMLTSLAGRPLLSAGKLAGLVSGGQVRYALLGRGACATSAARTCAPAVKWAMSHARDVSPSAGLPPETLYALGTATARTTGV